MSSIWEIMAIAVLIGGAVAYLGHRVWRTFAGSKAAGCGTGCGTCAHNQPNATADGDVVSLDSLTSSADKMPASRN
jgi:hypothetical protein